MTNSIKEKIQSVIIVMLINLSLMALSSCTEDWGEPLAKYESYGSVPPFVEAVDLGLSVKWASCNIGAAAPECFGNYYAWGESSTKDTYDENTYIFGQKYPYQKYNEDDLIHQLESIDDAATTCWGNNWRIPTADEFKELIEKCRWTATVVNGVNVYKITSKTNGKYIYMPAAGRYYQNELRDDRFYGHYWTSSARYLKDYNHQPSWEERAGTAYLRFTDSNYGLQYSATGRYDGYTIRPVYSSSNNNIENKPQDKLTAVDLGLSVKWANQNFDVSDNPSIQGLYGWGDPTGCLTAIDGNYAYDLNSSISGSEYDVVSSQLGGFWRIPTKEEFQELFDNCTWTYETQENISGFKITGTNGNHIFIPILGSREGETVIDNPINDGIGLHFCPGCFPNKTPDNHYFGTWTHSMTYWTANNGIEFNNACAVIVSEKGEVWHKEDEYPSLFSKSDFYYKMTNDRNMSFVEMKRYLGLAIRPVSD